MRNMETKDKREEIKVLDEKGNIRYIVIPNYRKNNLLTKEEQKFFTYLKQLTLKYNYLTFVQVALSQIVQVNNNHNYWHLLGKIKQLVIDFVIYDSFNEEIICCIELDDETHNKSKRIKRDIFIDEVFEEIKIPLVHIIRKNDYNNDTHIIENIIIEYEENLKQQDINN